MVTGSVGPDGLRLEQGQEAARWCALSLIATLQAELGDLDRVEKVVKLFGIVSSKVDVRACLSSFSSRLVSARPPLFPLATHTFARTHGTLISPTARRCVATLSPTV